jgi:hypothetical protein
MAGRKENPGKTIASRLIPSILIKKKLPENSFVLQCKKGEGLCKDRDRFALRVREKITSQNWRPDLA